MWKRGGIAEIAQRVPAVRAGALFCYHDSMRVIRSEDQEALKKEAGDLVGKVFRENTAKSILLLLSGGSSFGLLPYFDAALFGKRATITVLDERWSKDSAAGNFARVAETEFYEKAKGAGARFIDTRSRRGESHRALAKRFERALKEWRRAHPEGMVVATQGIGADGHTAGIMPYPENSALFRKLFEDPQTWVVGYDASGKSPHPLRVTVTLPFLRNQVDVSIVFITGEEKRQAFEKVVASEGTLAETPGRIIREIEEVHVFTELF